ncbi:MAG TPA: hypothetical protein PLC79_02545 [Phycisphaerae bacterium]|nr:hypothetical protein [Phycisphaerae bacterium]
MAKKIWNVAIVGPGWVAGAYVASFRKRDDVRVTHIVGRTTAGAAAFAAHSAGVSVTTDLAARVRRLVAHPHRA